MFVYCCALVAFWTEFLLEESDTCTPDMDCFVFHQGALPINFENCSEYEQNSSYTIECYRFVFDYAGALGNSGGVIVLATIIMNLHTLVWVKIRSQKNKCWKVVTVVVDMVGFSIINVAFICAMAIPLFRDQLFNTNRNILHSSAFYFTLLFTFIFSGPGLYTWDICQFIHKRRRRSYEPVQ